MLPALASLHERFGYVFDIRVDDQDHTLALLRDGSVLGAVTSAAKPVQGCNVHALGTMRYRAIASKAYAARHFPHGMDAASLGRAPMIVFNRKDELQWRFVRRITRARIAPPIHYIPTSSGFVAAAARGLGWCLAPESLVGPALAAGRIVVVEPERHLDVMLHWQHAAVASSTLQRVSQALRDAALAGLQA